MTQETQTSAPRIPTALSLSGLAWEVAAQRVAAWATNIAQLLSGDLRLGVHAACQIVTFDVITDAGGKASAAVRTRFTTRPAGVVVLQAVGTTGTSGGGVGVQVTGFTWDSGMANITVVCTDHSLPVTVTALVVLG